QDSNPENKSFLLPAIFTGVYVMIFPFAPPLLRAMIAFTALAASFSCMVLKTPLHVPSWGLLVLSLPVISSLQFYLGYPLRVVTGEIATPFLQAMGYSVVREGTILRWGEDLISIDAPCSGVRMLWVGFYLTFTLASFFQLRIKATVIASFFAFVSILAGNALRTAALFFVEIDVFPFPGWIHPGIGILIFLAVGLSILAFVQFLGKERPCLIAASS
ncbi:MAG: archaeosortase/exosortase family protein, partial [Candidatus Omnitrophica bacterium]|nr:archaeosortase/exosortase family protein [Candidatus Omnitrophota bacterium]